MEAHTEGWVAGLQLAALALNDRPDSAALLAGLADGNRYIVDYLGAEVLERLPAHLRTFLVQTAILDRMCGPLCDGILALGAPLGAQPLMEAPRPIASLLQLLALFPGALTEPVPPGQTALPEPLTARERQIPQLIAGGASNQGSPTRSSSASARSRSTSTTSLASSACTAAPRLSLAPASSA